jgi:hypothetical protein
MIDEDGLAAATHIRLGICGLPAENKIQRVAKCDQARGAAYGLVQ